MRVTDQHHAWSAGESQTSTLANMEVSRSKTPPTPWAYGHTKSASIISASQPKQDSTHTMGTWSHQVSLHLSSQQQQQPWAHIGANKFDTWIHALTILTTTSPHDGQMPSNEPTLWASAISVQHSWCPSCYARAHVHNMAHTLGNMILSECLPSSVSLLFPIMSSR